MRSAMELQGARAMTHSDDRNAEVMLVTSRVVYPRKAD